jgi:quinol monooxygenase YgiN
MGASVFTHSLTGLMKKIRLFVIAVLALLLPFGLGFAAEAPMPLVRIAELEIHPSHLEAYKAELKAEIEASVRLEPGVLSLYAVAVKGQPTRIRIFEVCADDAAYRAHLETPHFKRYKVTTGEMIRSLVLVETDPILLGARPR